MNDNIQLLVPTRASMVNDQLMTYAGGLIRNDKKLFKRRNRLSLLLTKLTYKDVGKTSCIVGSINADLLEVIYKANIKDIIAEIIASRDLYPYTTLHYLLLMLNSNIKVGNYITLKEYKPQIAVLQNEFKDKKNYDILDIISINFTERLKADRDFIVACIMQTEQVVDKTKVSKDEILSTFDTFLGGRNTQATPSIEAVIVNFIKTFDARILRTIVDDKTVNKLLSYRSISNQELELLITDEHYEIYLKYEKIKHNYGH